MPNVQKPAVGEMNCPACNAHQIWSNECRRCRCDLSVLHAVWLKCQRLRSQCLRQLRAGDYDLATLTARRYASLWPGEDAGRLLAVSSLLKGDWSSALAALRLA